MALPLLEYKPT
nr:RecName: Full=Phycobilisome rod-core linker polypeptide CpcG3 [Anabaena sp. L-31]